MATLQLFILLFSLVVEAACPTPAKSATCKASASALGDPANVTCYFNTVLDDPNMEIMVVHHPLGATNNDLGKDVLVCFRSGNADKPNCITRDGYRFNDSISDRLTLEIPVVTPDCAGEYACHIIPPDGFVVHSCKLSVPDSSVTPADTTEYANRPTDAGGSPCAQTDGCHATITALASALVGVTILLMLIQAIVIVRLRSRLRKRNGHVENQPEDAEKDPLSAEPFISPNKSQPQQSFLSNTWSCLAKRLRARRTTDDRKDTDDNRSMTILSTSDEDLNESQSGNFFERSRLSPKKAKALKTESKCTSGTQTDVSTKHIEQVAQPEESKKDR